MARVYMLACWYVVMLNGGEVFGLIADMKVVGVISDGLEWWRHSN